MRNLIQSLGETTGNLEIIKDINLEENRNSFESSYRNLITKTFLFTCQYVEDNIKLKLLERKIISKYSNNITAYLNFNKILKPIRKNIFGKLIYTDIYPYVRIDLWILKNGYSLNVRTYVIENNDDDGNYISTSTASFPIWVILDKSEYNEYVEKFKSDIIYNIKELITYCEGGDKYGMS